MPPKELPRTIGRFEVLDRIGHGGMGVVYRARDPHIGRLVAIKLLKVSDESVSDRFLQEARLAGQLKHRNIVTVYDYGEVADGGQLDGRPFIVMEFIEGITLRELIHSNVILSLARKLDLIGDLAAGLDYAHNRGVIHRDVKPANIMIDLDGMLRILDFGVARAGESALTQPGSMMGTPSYMSPEQIEGRPVDRRSDVFAVGLVCYELLSGRQAFSGEISQVLHAITRGEAKPLSLVCPDLDVELVAIVNKAIQRDEMQRYQNLAALATDIAQVRGRLETGAAEESIKTVVAPHQSRPGSERTPRQTPRDQFVRRRSEIIEGHLERARRSFESGDYAGAIEAAEQAALLDPEERRVLDVLDSARVRLDEHQIEEWLAEAARSIQREDFDGASELVAKALTLDPGSGSALRIQSSIARARQQLEHDRDAAAAVESANKRFAAGDPAGALSLLDSFRPTHPSVSRARDDLAAQLLEIERRKRLESDRRRVEAFSNALSAAERLVEQGAFDEAMRALADADAVDPRNARLLDLRRQIAARREEAWARIKRMTQALSTAGQAISAGDFDVAERSADEVLELEPTHADAQALKKRAVDARQEALQKAEMECRAREVEAQRLAAEARVVEARQEASQKAEADRRAREVEAQRLAAEARAVEARQEASQRAEADRRAREVESQRLAGEAQRLVRDRLARESREPDAIPTLEVPERSTKRSTAAIVLGVSGIAACVALFSALFWRDVVPGSDRVTAVLPTSPPSSVASTSSLVTSIPVEPVPITPATVPPPVRGAPADSGAVTPRAPVSTPVTEENRVAVATTSIPFQPEPAVSSAPPSVATSALTTSSVTTSIPPTPPLASGIDRNSVDQILAAYADAMRRLDMDAVQRLYPSAPASMKIRIAALRRNFSQCDMTFQNMRIASSTAAEAVVTVDSIEACKPKTKQSAIEIPGRHQFHLIRDSAGNWTIRDLFTQ